mgnify:CR=1 FL=1
MVFLQASIVDAETNNVTDYDAAIDYITTNVMFTPINMTKEQGYNKKRDFAIDVLKNDCITFLYETLYKFDNSKGTKAFSYFNVVAKNWLVLNSRRTRRITHNHLSLANQDRFSVRDKDLIANYQIAQAPDELMISQEFRGEIMKTLEHIRNKVKSSGKSKNDIACAEAVVTVFEQVDQLDFLNKRAIFVYVRNISGLNSKQLSASMSSIRKIYREYKQTNKDLF